MVSTQVYACFVGALNKSYLSDFNKQGDCAMFIKAFASGGGTAMQRRVNAATGVTGRGRSMSAFYRNGGVSRMGGNARTRGRAAAITPVRGR